MVDKLLHLVRTSELHLHVGFCARLLGTLVEHVADMLRLDVHLQDALPLVHDDLRGIAVVHHVLEVGVGCILRDAAVRGTSTGEVEQAQRDDGHHIDPVHIELWHVHLRAISAVIILYLFIVHLIFNL